MTVQGPDDGGTPRDREDGVPSLPDDVWQRFLMDSEQAIRTSAPWEPSAVQRAAGRSPQPPQPPRAPEPAQRPSPPPRHDTPDPVGDLWQPDDPWEGPAWRDLDARARLRRIGRVVGTAAAIALALGAWSQLSTGAGAPAEGPGDTVLQQSEEAPVTLPPGASVPAGLTTPSATEIRTG
ncbi:hypothetical protein QWL27_30655 [Streptomyces thermocarboxydus]|uniref:Peptidoglycan-binding protein n=1 Tax=Streptomyces cellulosae TaxID=1968 RepID=A0ABW6JDA1_STRCE|nr:hypothetical protein [Streptomyces thermocarboxydus]GHE46540.1 hypothetical protein GCM10018771_29330 [Streptomyces cellulosae]